MSRGKLFNKNDGMLGYELQVMLLQQSWRHQEAPSKGAGFPFGFDFSL
jgi:hypothetical protein